MGTRCLRQINGGYVRHGVENPALYRLMFGGFLTGPDDDRPAIERTAAEKKKALLADAIIHGALGRAIPNSTRNERKIAGAILIFLVTNARSHFAADRPTRRPKWNIR